MLSIVISLSEIKKVFIASFTSFIPTAINDYIKGGLRTLDLHSYLTGMKCFVQKYLDVKY